MCDIPLYACVDFVKGKNYCVQISIRATCNIKLRSLSDKRRRSERMHSTKTEMTQLRVALLLILITTVYASLQSIHRVPCGIDAASCSCSNTATTCEFDLQISLLQTFTRYPVKGTDIHDFDGFLHYIDDNGRIVSYDGNSYDNGFTEAATVDGKTYRPYLAVNGRSPGPTLIVTENQRVVVNVKNNLRGEVITIHWHGQLLQDTPWMDGVPFISQCPLTSGGVFRYIFKAQPSGTFWYHSHVEGQRGDGLLGALIVREKTPEPSYEYLCDLPDRHTLVLQDWWSQPFSDVLTVSYSAGSNFPTVVGELPAIGSQPYSTSIIPDGSEHGTIPFHSALINGKGKHRDVPLRKSRLATFKVDYNKSYRFRVIGGQMLFGFKLSIDQHKLTVISSDGLLIQPIREVDYLIVYPGERYDFILTANGNPSKNYWIRVETLEVNDADPKMLPYPSLGNSARAVLYYSSSKEPRSTDYLTIQSTRPNCTKSSPCIAVNCPFQAFHESYHTTCVNVGDFKLLNPTSMASLASNEPSPGQEYFLNFGYSGPDGELPDNINGRSFMMPPEPLQLQSLFGSLDLRGLTCPAQQPNSCLNGCTCLHMLSIPYGKTVRLVLVNFGEESHAIHLHGHSFFVTAVGYGGYSDINGFVSNTNASLSCQSDEMDENSFSTKRPCTTLHWRKGKRPVVNLSPYTVRKDTVIVPSGAYVIIQFVSSSPGYWFLHCHLDPHHVEGMAIVLNVAESLQKLAPLGMTSCGDFKLPIIENPNLRCK